MRDVFKHGDIADDPTLYDERRATSSYARFLFTTGSVEFYRIAREHIANESRDARQRQ